MTIKSLSSIIDDIYKRRPGWEKRRAQGIIWRKWRQIVGDNVSQYAWPVKVLKDNTLFVIVADHIWMNQLFMERLNILSLLNEGLPEGAKISDIRLKVGEIDHNKINQNMPRGHKINKKNGNNTKIPPAIKRQADEITGRVSDAELKKRLQRLYIAFKLRKAYLEGSNSMLSPKKSPK